MDIPLRFAIVGAGRIAQSYVQALENCEVARLAAVADARPEAAKSVAQKAGCPWYTSAEEMTEVENVDAVVICTPPSTHADLALALLERQVHVLCEKPFSLTSANAQRMANAAQSSGVKLTMASKFRYVDDVIRARNIVFSGVLGDIVLFENAFTSFVDMKNRWNANPEISGGGVLIDNGTHSVDLMRYFLGPLSTVQVVEGKRAQSLPVEDTVRIFVRSVGGVMGSIDLSWSINKELDNYLCIYGSQGTVQVGWQQSRYRQTGNRDWVVFGKGYDKVEAFRNQITNFARAILGQETLLIGLEDALASVDVIESAYQSLHEEHWTDVRTERADELPRSNGQAAPLLAGQV